MSCAGSDRQRNQPVSAQGLIQGLLNVSCVRAGPASPQVTRVVAGVVVSLQIKLGHTLRAHGAVPVSVPGQPPREGV